jgi:hypothetical protein
MLPPIRKIRARCERGSVSVEAAFMIVFVLVPLLSFVLLFGRYFWYYTVAQKAAHDGALYMATAPLNEIKDAGAVGFSNWIMGREMADLDAASNPQSWALCGYRIPAGSSTIQYFGCSSTSKPAAVRAAITMTVSDPFLKPFTGLFNGGQDYTIMVVTSLTYVGR